MKLMTVSEYANAMGVSVQSVYKKINRGTLEAEEKDGVKYLKAPNQPQGQPDGEEACNQIIKEYKLIIKELKKQIKALKKDKDKNYERLAQLFNVAVKQQGGFSSLQYKGEDVIDVKADKKKKKGKK